VKTICERFSRLRLATMSMAATLADPQVDSFHDLGIGRPFAVVDGVAVHGVSARPHITHTQ